MIAASLTIVTQELKVYYSSLYCLQGVKLGRLITKVRNKSGLDVTLSTQRWSKYHWVAVEKYWPGSQVLTWYSGIL